MEKPLLRLPEVAALLDRSLCSVRRAWYAGELPAPIRVGRRGVRWRRVDLEQFISAAPDHFPVGQVKENV